MAHFAEIDALHKVIQVVVLDDKDTQDSNGNEEESIGAKYLHDGFGGTWLRTSYNTVTGEHILGGTPFRKNYAQLGYAYDETRNAFIPPKPYPSWTLNEDMCIWDSPVPYPGSYPSGSGLETGETDVTQYQWNEDTTSWDEVDMGAE
jgi:hypothetical protein